jgi:hypothetical protein
MADVTHIADTIHSISDCIEIFQKYGYDTYKKFSRHVIFEDDTYFLWLVWCIYCDYPISDRDLEKYRDTESYFTHYTTLLYQAYKFCRIKIIKKLEDLGARHTTSGKYCECTPLIYATRGKMFQGDFFCQTESYLVKSCKGVLYLKHATTIEEIEKAFDIIMSTDEHIVIMKSEFIQLLKDVISKQSISWTDVKIKKKFSDILVKCF